MIKYLCGFSFFVLLFSLMAGPGGASPGRAEDVSLESAFNFTPRLQLAYFEIQKLRLDEARELIEQERRLQPGNGVLAYLDNYADMYYLLITEDRNAFNRLSPKEDLRLTELSRLPDSSPFQRLLMAEVRLHWAFAKLKFGNEVSACWDIIRAYRLLDENSKKFPQFVPTYKSLGLLHVLIGSVPENYTWVTKILGLKGNVREGLRELQLVQQKDAFFRQETHLIDLLLHAFTLQLSPPQLQALRQLPAQHPDNLLLHFFGASVLMKEGRSEEALAILNKAPTGAAYLDFPFLSYMRGEILLQKGEYKQASVAYTRFQRDFKGFNFLKDSYFKLFLCQWLSGKAGDPEGFLAKVKKAGSTIVESDQYAMRFAERYLAGQVPDEQKVLFKVRYATDGGYLKEAWKELEPYREEEFSSVSDRAEYNYRKGRVLQKMGQDEQAVAYFNRCVQLTRNTNLYFGASSALQLGYIYREKRQREQAITSFRLAMTYKKHEYKNSIDNKARAALTELGV
ncbi:tetratricopeptide repeat protein [Telluribacter sp.]|jgi:tetratricopeptide (TPR) repeat protein|uniref:tetratricopeptide repeat protein n=1 Tax=Telluribacter sp. TaxID=1978767 RepID=UPI002E0F2F5D|nr:tetratricopeptide repeat protein [Telluribacter sp.]